jgi:hypothetical protein
MKEKAIEVLNTLINSSYQGYFVENNVQLRTNGEKFFIKPYKKPGYFVSRDTAIELIEKSLV